MDKKMALLQMINAEKKLIFGKFTPGVEKTNKIAGWNRILEKAKALELATSDRTWEYVRDSLWATWKKRAMVSFPKYR